jgi:NAD+ synthase (glutamine-hydrolysing)
MKVALLQLNFIVGDFDYNYQKIVNGYAQAVSKDADLVVATELALFGYPPADLLFRRRLLDLQQHYFCRLCEHIGSVGLIIGIATPTNRPNGMPLYNSAVLVRNGNVAFQQNKSLLPNYDVFDEKRYFEPSPKTLCPFEYDGYRMGLLICEDIWGGNEEIYEVKRYHRAPVDAYMESRLDALVVINASPYHSGKTSRRLSVIKNTAKKLNCPVIYANQVGANDGLVFAGNSGVFDSLGNPTAVATSFGEDCLLAELKSTGTTTIAPSGEQDLYQALTLSVKDYVKKTGLRQKAYIGLSGGIDSAVTAVIGADALGPENITGVAMPSPFSSDESVEDSQALANNLGLALDIIPIDDIYDAFKKSLAPNINWYLPGSKEGDVTEENIQARIRGDILMGYANRNGGIVLATGNKSELSVGYCTLYGDMVGGFGVLSDVPKTRVYALGRYINKGGETIPDRSLTKPPSAELRPNQKDLDALPEYDLLDPIIEAYIENGWDADAIIKKGYDAQMVIWVISRINFNEYKRRQMPVGPIVTRKAFGIGRRWPIACRYLME